MSKYLAAALAACLLLIYGGWQKIQGQARDIDTARGQVATLEAAAESRRNTQRLLLELDTKHTTELTNAQADITKLRADVADGKRRLSVKARCPAVRATGTATSVDDAEARAELDPAAAGRIIGITGDGDEGLIALAGLQEYVATVCLHATAK